MLDEARWAFEGNHYDWLFIAGIIFSLLFLKGKRKILIIPAMLITVVVINPLMYDLWYKFNDRAYWRLIWIVPIIVISAIVPSFFVDRAKNNWNQIGTLIIAVAVVMLCGFMVYAHGSTTFKEAKNADKLPEDVVETAGVLLEINKHPYVVADASISTYIRQVSGNIKTMYTRDVVFGTVYSSLVKEVYEALINYDFVTVAQKMLMNDYEYLVTNNDDPGKAVELEKTGFRLLRQTGKYGIYEVMGDGKRIRVFDEFQRLSRIEIVDKNDNLMNGEDGYAIHTYEYDDYNRAIREIFLDAENNPVNTIAGYSEIQTKYAEGKLSLTYFTDKDGNSVNCGSGFFHQYLLYIKSMLDRGDNIAVFFSIRDEGTNALTETLQKDFYALGLYTRLIGKMRSSYCAVITKDTVKEAFDNDKEVILEGSIGNNTYRIISAGYEAGDKSSIQINGKENSLNGRGMNIVIYDLSEQKVIHNVSVDTHMRDMSALGIVCMDN